MGGGTLFVLPFQGFRGNMSFGHLVFSAGIFLMGVHLAIQFRITPHRTLLAANPMNASLLRGVAFHKFEWEFHFGSCSVHRQRVQLHYSGRPVSSGLHQRCAWAGQDGQDMAWVLRQICSTRMRLLTCLSGPCCPAWCWGPACCGGNGATAPGRSLKGSTNPCVFLCAWGLIRCLAIPPRASPILTGCCSAKG